MRLPDKLILITRTPHIILYNHVHCMHILLFIMYIDSKTFDKRVYNLFSRYLSTRLTPPVLNWIFSVGFRILLYLWCIGAATYIHAQYVGRRLGINKFVFSSGRLIFFANPITVDGRFKYVYAGDFHHCQSKRPLVHPEMTSVDTLDDDDDDERQKPDGPDMYL